MGKFLRSGGLLHLFFLWVLTMMLINALSAGDPVVQTLDSREWRQHVENGDFVTGLGKNHSGALTVKDEDQTVTGLLDRGDGREQEFEYSYTQLTDVAADLEGADIPFYTDPQSMGFWTRTLVSIAPIFIVLLLLLFVMRSMQGNQSNREMSLGKSRARRMTKDQPKVTFSDVAGADEAVQELTEIKEFLEAPQKIQKLGARIPKGALLVGPPGTGKTLLLGGRPSHLIFAEFTFHALCA